MICIHVIIYICRHICNFFSLIQFEYWQIQLLESQLEQNKEDSYFGAGKKKKVLSIYSFKKSFIPHILPADFASFEHQCCLTIYFCSILRVRFYSPLHLFEPI